MRLHFCLIVVVCGYKLIFIITTGFGVTLLRLRLKQHLNLNPPYWRNFSLNCHDERGARGKRHFYTASERSHDIITNIMKKEEIIEEKENLVLKSITDRSANKPGVDSLVEGPVILVRKSSVFVDLSPFGTGIIYGKEFINAKDIIKKISLGDIINFYHI